MFDRGIFAPISPQVKSCKEIILVKLKIMEKWVVFLEERYFSLTGKVWEFCLQHDWPWFISLVYILNFQVTYWIMPSDRRENVCVEQSHAPTRNWLPWHISVFRHWWPSEWEMERGMMSQIFRQARTIKHIWMCLICACGELLVFLSWTAWAYCYLL